MWNDFRLHRFRNDNRIFIGTNNIFKKVYRIRKYTMFKFIIKYFKVVNTNHLEICLYGIFNNVFETKMKIEEREISIDGKTICSTATMKDYERPIS